MGQRSSFEFVVMKRETNGLNAPRRSARAAWEISFVILCVLIAEWAILPLFGRDFLIGSIPVLVAFLFMFLSHRAHGETPRELGWGLDNFPRALLVLTPPMVLATAFLILVGWVAGQGYTGRYVVGWRFLWVFWWMFVWGLMQQYALQAFINRRAQAIWGKGAYSILFVAAVFGLLHLPNLWLTLATFTGGLLWATVYQRVPNLWALAFSHSLMTVVLASTVPYSALHGLRVGYNYFR